MEVYHRGTGQLVNRDKSAVFFSANASDEMKQEFLETMEIGMEALAEKYLGLPTAVGRSTKDAFEYMPTRIKSLVGSWSGKEASCAGRKVLLKSKAQAIPTYPISCFLLPKSTCKKKKTTIVNYWWGSSADNQHMHWMRWDLLTQPKLCGGMGFKDLPMFNKAMLGKQGWRLLSNSDSLCARVLKGRYYHDGDFLTATRKNHASQTWRAILVGREALQEGLVKRIGDGLGTNIWETKWIHNHPTGRPFTPYDPRVTMIAYLLNNDQWDEDLIRDIFCDFDAEAILSTSINGRGGDFWSWAQ
ncbi:hypothetical protein PR202_ga26477 [Eleusine coracana subsp. coracana]|uniref:Uncharacterized protein n=1 Tax=Eleusine coracana subsp. coracana TaxID=191504 RepID=A0AAV5DEB9_ELECO|nr:hypothetical protein PR202_ga26477 [Eleusine coracana subsp. coracana]